MIPFLRFVLASSTRARLALVAAAVVGVVSGASSVGLLALINENLTGESSRPLSTLAWLFVGLCLVVTLSRVLSQYLLARIGQGMLLELRMRLADQILTAPLAQIEKLGPNRLWATLTDDVNALMQSTVFIPVLCINGTIVLGCLGYLAWLNAGLFLMLVVVVIVGVVSYQLPAAAGIQRFVTAREEQDVLFHHLTGLTEGVKELKLHSARQRAFLGLLEGSADRVRRLRVVATVIFGAASAWGHLLFFVVIGLMLFARPYLVSAGPTVLVSYTVVLLYMMTPLQTVLDGYPNLGRAGVAAEKVRKLGFDLSPEVPIQDTVVEPPEWQSLELRGVTHTYHRERQEHPFTLGPIDLELTPGELVFLVGGNGSGKTTLAKILVGLYIPENGDLVLDGEPVTADSLEAYRQMFSVVFADFYLFDRLLGLEDGEGGGSHGLDARATRYLEDLELDHKVRVEGGKLSTTSLSQGQRKRLALLTSYMEDRSVYVFDEWAADQDPVFKEVFYRHVIDELRKRGKLVICISHDDRYFHLADRVLKLEDGKVRQEVSVETESERRMMSTGAPPPLS